jgi:hypothetical protein
MRVSEKARVVLDAIGYLIVMIPDKLRKTLGNRDLIWPAVEKCEN